MQEISAPVWIVDDDHAIRWVLERALQREGISFQSFSSAVDPLALIEKEDPLPGVLICDVRMPGPSGLEFLQCLSERKDAPPVIIMTAFADLKNTVSAFQGGAYDFLPKPFDVDHAVALIRRALRRPKVLQEAADVPEEHLEMPEIIGQSQAMQTLFRAMGRLVNSHATVLITGESGTGKELVARALHRHGPRHAASFIAINSAAIPRDLLESELFGHERGAFTGAVVQRQGRFQQAEGGTLFLDEIGDMPLDLQARLLRVLSDRHYYRVGGHTPIKADVRIVAATHQNLEELVQEKLFRQDLLYRLNVIRLRLPSLRERREDIPLLARHFLQNDVSRHMSAKTLTPAALRRLQELNFPGNIRQLENLCHWLNTMVPGPYIEKEDIPVDAVVRDSLTDEKEDWMAALGNEATRLLQKGDKGLYPRLLQDFERILFARALMMTGQRRNDAAAMLGIGRNTLTRKLKELGFPPAS